MKSPEITLAPVKGKTVNVTPFAVVLATLASPRSKAPTGKPVVLTSESPVMPATAQMMGLPRRCR